MAGDLLGPLNFLEFLHVKMRRKNFNDIIKSVLRIGSAYSQGGAIYKYCQNLASF